MVLTSPGPLSTSHEEITAILFKGPDSRDFLTIEHAVVHDEVLTYILLLEVSHAIWFNITVYNELANFVDASASNDIAGACLETEPCHRILLTILFVVSLPHGIACPLVICRLGGSRWRYIIRNVHRFRMLSRRMIFFSRFRAAHLLDKISFCFLIIYID